MNFVFILTRAKDEILLNYKNPGIIVEQEDEDGNSLPKVRQDDPDYENFECRVKLTYFELYMLRKVDYNNIILDYVINHTYFNLGVCTQCA